MRRRPVAVGMMFAFAVLLSFVARAGAISRPGNLKVIVEEYANYLVVNGDFLNNYVLRAMVADKNGAIVASIELFPPFYNPATDDDTNGTGMIAALFFTDWAPEAWHFGILPGYTVTVDFLNAALLSDTFESVSHKLAKLALTKIDPRGDVIAGKLSPRIVPEVYYQFAGMDLNDYALPTGGSGTLPVGQGGGFKAKLRGSTELLRNSLVIVSYLFDEFSIIRRTWAPGVIIVKDTPYTLATGDQVMTYRAKVRRNNSSKGSSTTQFIPYLGAGLFLFHNKEKQVPVRNGDNVRVSGSRGVLFEETVPENFSFTINRTGPGAYQAVITGDPDQRVMYSIPTTTSTVTIGVSGQLTVDFAYTDPAPGGNQHPTGFAVIQNWSGSLVVAHQGFQNNLSDFLTSSGLLQLLGLL